jgi:hypothetical protein
MADVVATLEEIEQVRVRPKGGGGSDGSARRAPLLIAPEVRPAGSSRHHHQSIPISSFGPSRKQRLRLRQP